MIWYNRQRSRPWWGHWASKSLNLLKHFQNDSFSSCTKWLISFLNFTVFSFGKYFLKKTLTNPSHVEIEFAGRLCIYFFAESFNAKGIKRNLTTSWDTLGNCIMEHTSSNSLKNKYASPSPLNSRSMVVYWGLNANCTFSPSSGIWKQEGLVDLGG